LGSALPRRGFQPPGYDELRRRLVKSRVLVLTGPAGSGKRTTALYVLRDQLDRDGKCGHVIELAPDWESPDPARLPAEPARGYLLDLRESIALLHRSLAQGLREHAGKLEAAGSYLVITATEQQWRECSDTFKKEHEPPAADEVIQQELDERAQAWLTRSKADPRLSGALSNVRSPADAVRLAAAITRAVDKGRPGIEQALDEFHHWARYLKEWFNRNPGERRRVLLVAAALVDGCTVDELFETAAALREAMRGRRLMDPPMAGAGRRSELEALGAEVDGTGAVSLSRHRPGLHDGVIDYVLQDFRDALVDGCWGWVTGPGFTATSTDLRRRLAGAIVGWAARFGEPAFLGRLPGLVRSEPEHRQLAGMLLEQAVLHPVIGPVTRRRAISMAEAPKTDQTLVELLGELSGRVIGVRFPTVALCILRGILQRDRPPEAATAWLTTLAEHGDNRRLVLYTVVAKWMSCPTYQRAGETAFVALMRPGPHTVAYRLLADACSDAGVLCLLMAGWRRLRRGGLPEEVTAELVRGWAAEIRAGRLRRGVAGDLLLLAIKGDLRATSPLVEEVLTLPDP
jgi:hypothetical protein